MKTCIALLMTLLCVAASSRRRTVELCLEHLPERESEHVCASDGRIYGSYHDLRRANCYSRDRDIRVRPLSYCLDHVAIKPKHASHRRSKTRVPSTDNEDVGSRFDFDSPFDFENILGNKNEDKPQDNDFYRSAYEPEGDQDYGHDASLDQQKENYAPHAFGLRDESRQELEPQYIFSRGVFDEPVQLPYREQHHLPYAGRNRRPYGGQHRLPYEGQHRLPYEGQHRLPYEGQHRLPHEGQHRLPHEGQHRLPHEGQHRLPHEGQHRLPHEEQHRLPHEGQHRLPHEEQHHLQYERQQQLQYERQQQLQYERQHQLEYERQHQLEYERQHQLEYERQHQLLNERQHRLPHEGQNRLPHEGQHQLPYEGQHQLQYEGEHQLPYQEQHNRPNQQQYQQLHQQLQQQQYHHPYQLQQLQQPYQQNQQLPQQQYQNIPYGGALQYRPNFVVPQADEVGPEIVGIQLHDQVPYAVYHQNQHPDQVQTSDQPPPANTTTLNPSEGHAVVKKGDSLVKASLTVASDSDLKLEVVNATTTHKPTHKSTHAPKPHKGKATTRKPGAATKPGKPNVKTLELARGRNLEEEPEQPEMRSGPPENGTTEATSTTASA